MDQPGLQRAMGIARLGSAFVPGQGQGRIVRSVDPLVERDGVFGEGGGMAGLRGQAQPFQRARRARRIAGLHQVEPVFERGTRIAGLGGAREEVARLEGRQPAALGLGQAREDDQRVRLAALGGAREPAHGGLFVGRPGKTVQLDMAGERRAPGFPGRGGALGMHQRARIIAHQIGAGGLRHRGVRGGAALHRVAGAVAGDLLGEAGRQVRAGRLGERGRAQAEREDKSRVNASTAACGPDGCCQTPEETAI